MGLLWRISLPSKEDRETYDGSHFTWKDYAEKMFLKIMGRHPNASEFHFINDRYDVGVTTKDMQHEKDARYILVEVKTCSPKQIWEFHLLIILVQFL